MKAKCINPRCGLTFESDAITIVNSTVKDMGDNFTSCPNCGALAKFPEGSFKFDEKGILHLFSNAEITSADLTAIKQLIVTATKEPYTPEEFTLEAKKINPLFYAIKAFMPENKADWYAFLGLLLSLLSFVVPQGEASNTVNNKTEVTINNHYTIDKPAKNPPKKNTNFTPPKKKRKK